MSCLYNKRHVKVTRKPHRCEYCGKTIPAGSCALCEWGIYDGVPFRRYACNNCIPLLDDFWAYYEYEVEGDIRDAFDGFLEACEGEYWDEVR